ncbi:MAG: copper chaperone PCu(A)C [Pseudomonadota bacterium]|nr:copper chaperone PCu(A)C [Pseudomonadota bacterium]
MRNSKYLFFALFFFLSTEVRSERNNIVFHGAYTFETFIGQNASSVYVSIFNNTDKDFIIKSLSTDIAENSEIHNTIIENDIMKMKKIDNLKISKQSQIFFQPGGTHIMLKGLKERLKDGSSFSIRFFMDDQSVKEVDVLVVNKELRENFIK